MKDVDFDDGSILARCGKGMKDRITVLPYSVRAPLEAHIASVRRLHERDVKRGGGYVELPYALGRQLLGARRDRRCSGRGSGYFRSGGSMWISVPGRCVDIIFTSQCCSEP